MSIQAMKQALEAMQRGPWTEVTRQEYNDAVAALRTAIYEQEKCEPVAIVGELCDQSRADAIRRGYSVGQYMFTHPQPAIPKGWQGCGECDCKVADSNRRSRERRMG